MVEPRLATHLRRAAAAGCLGLLLACAQTQPLLGTSRAATLSPVLGSAPSLAELKFKVDPQYRNLGPPGPFFPERALRLNVSGHATLACLMAADQTLNDCQLVEETPANSGFAAAAIKMALSGWMTAAQPDAQQSHRDDGRILARVDFRAP